MGIILPRILRNWGLVVLLHILFSPRSGIAVIIPCESDTEYVAVLCDKINYGSSGTYTIAVDSNNNFVIAGLTYDNKLFVAKYTESCSLLYQIPEFSEYNILSISDLIKLNILSIPMQNFLNARLGKEEELLKVTVDSGDTVYIVGSVIDTAQLLIKAVIWKIWPDFSHIENVEVSFPFWPLTMGTGIFVDSNYIWISGVALSLPNRVEGFVAKLDKVNFQVECWEHHGGGILHPSCYSDLCAGSDGYIYATGFWCENSQCDSILMTIVKYRPSDCAKIADIYPFEQILSNSIKSRDGSLFIVGETGVHGFVAKIANDLSPVWSIVDDSSIVLDELGFWGNDNLAVTGEVENQHFYVLLVNSVTGEITKRILDSEGNAASKGIAVDKENNLVITGIKGDNSRTLKLLLILGGEICTDLGLEIQGNNYIEYTTDIFDAEGIRRQEPPTSQPIWYICKMKHVQPPVVWWLDLIVCYDPTICDTLYTIYPGSGNIMCGIAYDSRDSSFWCTSLNAPYLFHIDRVGNLIDSFYVGFTPITGLAFDRDNYHLWGIVRGNPDMFLEFDVSCGIPVLLQGPFPVPWLGDSPPYAAAGLDYDERENQLVAINCSTRTVECFCDLCPSYTDWNKLGDSGVSPTGACIVIDEYKPYAAFWGFYEDTALFVIGRDTLNGTFPLYKYRSPCNFTCSHPCGDANEDGEVDYTDLIFFANYLFAGGPPPCDMWLLDLNKCSGTVDYVDLIYLARYIYENGPAPHCCDINKAKHAKR